MKAISLWQPWASLLATEIKKYETRSWATNYRGPIAIHAAKRRPPRQGEISHCSFQTITDALTKYYGAWRYDWHLGGTRINSDGTDNGFDIPLGTVIATAELVDCHEITYSFRCTKINFTDEEYFGDFTIGRYAWEFANMNLLKEPIPAKGMQGLWNWEVTNETT
jgi:hypothetical protein